MKTFNILSIVVLATFAATLPNPGLPSGGKIPSNGQPPAGINGNPKPVATGPKSPPTSQGPASTTPSSTSGQSTDSGSSLQDPPSSNEPTSTTPSPTSGAPPAESSGFNLWDVGTWF